LIWKSCFCPPGLKSPPPPSNTRNTKAGRNGALSGVPTARTVHSAERVPQDRDAKTAAGTMTEPAGFEAKVGKDPRGGNAPRESGVNRVNGGSIANLPNPFQRFI